MSSEREKRRQKREEKRVDKKGEGNKATLNFNI
jgi:hypothetical protein